MGNRYTKVGTPNTDGNIDCASDADCYKETTTITLASTVAEKSKRCCMYYGIDAVSRTQKTTAETTAALELNGLPQNLKTYTQYCNYDYPTYLTALPTTIVASGGSYVTQTNSYLEKDGTTYQTYCDGGAMKLAAAASAAAAITIVIY